MADEITLEVQLDLPLDTDDIARYNAYIASGRTVYEAAAQVEHERTALEAAEWGMAYGYFAAVLGAENRKS